MKEIDEIQKERLKWERETAGPRREEMRKPTFLTSGGIPLSNVYTPADVDRLPSEYLAKLGFPGQFPFTRGADPLGYRTQFWRMATYQGYGSAEDARQRYVTLFEQGVTAIGIAMDLPTQMGLDSDHPLAEGEVGRVGVAVSSLKDMEWLLQGLIERATYIGTVANAVGPVMIAMFQLVGEKAQISPERYFAEIQNDPLKEYFARGCTIFPPKAAVRFCTDVFRYLIKKKLPWGAMKISGYHIRESGATAIQELAFTIADGMTYLDELVNRGVNIDDAGPFSFFLGAGIDLFEEVAKFRAFRRIWATIMKERYQAKRERSMVSNLQTYTLGSLLTAQQPWNNVIRTTLATLGAVLGGTQMHTVSCMDEALCLPTEQSARIANNLQYIVAYEDGVADVADPLGGSYFVEKLTDEIEEKVLEILTKIQDMGGAVAAIEKGYFVRELSESASKFQRGVEDGNRVVVGLNKYQVEEEIPIGIFRVDPEAETRQIERLKAVKRERNASRVKDCLKRLEDAAVGDDEVVSAVLEAVREYATVGEICETLKGVWGEYKEIV